MKLIIDSLRAVPKHKFSATWAFVTTVIEPPRTIVLSSINPRSLGKKGLPFL